MAKNFEKAVTGFNHNIKHKGRVYHVQTEDSGVSNPHIITHLFVGGNILASKKTSYQDIVNAENLPELVKEMMEEQHKEMLRNLIGGTYDTIENLHSRHYHPGHLAHTTAAAATHPAPVCINAPRPALIDALQKAAPGPPAPPLGAAPMAYVLWQRHLKHNPSDPLWADRDRFVLSAGHGCMLLYSLLHVTGYPLTLE